MAGLDRSSFNTEPGLRSISFSLYRLKRARFAEAGPFFCVFYKLFLFVLGRMCYTKAVVSANERGIWFELDRMCLV